MAISEDTAALVAAQLTQAWAVRTSGRAKMSDKPEWVRLLEVYDTFLTQISEGDAEEANADASSR